MNFLPGHYSAARRAIVLEGGTVVALPAEHRAKDGQLVRLGIRSEHVSLRAPGHGMLDARLEIVEDLGATRLWKLNVEDIPFSLITDARAHPPAGSSTGPAFDMRAAHLFDGDTGQRIESSVAALQTVPA